MSDETIFSDALAIADADERAAYLDRACGGDAERRRRIDGLLAAALESNPLDRPPTDLDWTGAYQPAAAEPAASAGDRVGPYKLVEKIGAGGMGDVWTAQQTEPVKRVVALKLIKAGMDSRAVLARFEAERQALAVMDHPNIAKVLDAGTTADGRPYFVMELVKGVPITAFCDARKLTPKERLELFVPVCQAIQHAHQKGIIHRDIKPSNVLVALYDDRPVPKVIDFGVAKATGAQLTDHTMMTGFGAVVGTPEYMSPEQASFNQLDVDTRSDVYSLGVLLYELLAGSPPFARAELEKRGLLEMLRVVREEEPPRPSTKLSTADAKASISANRGIEPAKLAGLLKGELDWVVMRALEKDRTRRYETANSFAADVQRYLSGEQVQAVPPSLGYRLRKAYRRNKAAVWVATAFTLLMAVGVGIASLLAVRARDAEAVANTNADAARTAEAEAKQERDNVASANAELARVADLQRRTRYAAEMNLVQAAYNSGDMTRFRAILDDQKPKPGETDIRGFEWHYWDRKMNGHANQVRIPLAQAGEIEEYPDGQSNLPNLRDDVLSADGTRLVTHCYRIRKEDINPDGSFKPDYKKSHVVFRVWDTTTGKILHEYDRPLLETGRNLCRYVMRPDGAEVIVQSSNYPDRGSVDFPGPMKQTREVWCWEFATNTVRVLKQINNNSGDVLRGFSYSADFKATAKINVNIPKAEQTMHIRNAVDGKLLMEVDQPSRIIGGICFSPDGTHVVTSTRERPRDLTREAVLLRSPDVTLHCYKVGDPKPIWEQPMLATGVRRNYVPGMNVNSHQFIPDGSAVVALSGSTSNGVQPVLKLHDAKTGQVIGQHTLKEALHILAVNAEWVAIQISATRFGLIPMKRLREFKPKPNERPSEVPFSEFETEIGLPSSFAFSSDGKRMTAVSEVKNTGSSPEARIYAVLRTWSTPTEHAWGIENLAYSVAAPDASSFVVPASGEPSPKSPTAGTNFPWPRVYTADGKFVRELNVSAQTDQPNNSRFGYSGDGRTVYHAPGSRKDDLFRVPNSELQIRSIYLNSVEVYDLQSAQLIRKIEAEPLVKFISAALDREGKRLAIVAGYESNHAEVQKLPMSERNPTAAFGMSWIQLYEVTTGQLILKIKLKDTSVGTQIEFDEAGDVRCFRFVFGKSDLTEGYRVWDGKTGTEKEFVPLVPLGTLVDVARSRDGAVVVKLSFRNPGIFEVTRTTNMAGKVESNVRISYPAHYRCLLSPDGTRLLTCGDPDNREAAFRNAPPPKLWDTATGRELLTFGVTPRSASVDITSFQYQPYWSEDSTRIWVGIQRDGNLYAFDGRPLPEANK